MKIGFIGLGNMGLNYVKNLLDHDVEVVAWNRSPEKRERAKQETSAHIVDSVEDLVDELPEQKIVFSLIAAGPAIDKLLFNEVNGLAGMLKSGDIFVDMANSHYTETERRSDELGKRGVRMLGVGISGGVTAARNGACLMVGGDKEANDLLADLFTKSAEPDGYGYFGPKGSGHFVKMVHNGIEYGMMNAISEGIAIIDAKEEVNVNYSELLRVWNNGSIIQSNLIGYLKQAIDEEGNANLEKEESEIGSLGTGKWTAQEALNLGVPAPSIAGAVFARYTSRDKNWIGWRAVSAMRRIFGSHSAADRPTQ